MIIQQGGCPLSKIPSKHDFYGYTLTIVKKLVNKKAYFLPEEQKEEIIQDAMLRVFKAYDRLDESKNWEGLVYKHCRGAVLDYLRDGDGFRETAWLLYKENENQETYQGVIRKRISITTNDNVQLSVDQVAAIFGKYEMQVDSIKINWDLVARLAHIDCHVKVLAMWLRGHTLEKISFIFNVTAACIQQWIVELSDKITNKQNQSRNTEWTKQIMFAFGLCELLDLPAKDQQIGWDYPPEDLDNFQPQQMSLFGEDLC